MNAAALIVLLGFMASLLSSTEAAVSVSSATTSSWNGGKNIGLTFTNSGPNAICGVTFSASLPSGTTASTTWNMNSAGGSQYTLPSYVNIPVGGSFKDAGMTLSGSGNPTFSVVSSTPCGGGGGGGGATTTTTKAPGGGGGATTTTTKGPGTTTTTTAPGGGGTSLVVKADPANTALNSCFASTVTGPVTSVLNQPITGAIFTFYGAGGTGACGMNSGSPAMSAAASGDLFSSSQQWGPNCQNPNGQYMLKDAICVNKCIRIQYKCVGCSASKTLTVPITNKCPECHKDHVDLSQEAFLWLEPQGGTVGIARDATLTYIDC